MNAGVILSQAVNLGRERILDWLLETDEDRLESLWREADRVRREHVGDEVHRRGLIEVSNYCSRDCRYCGIRGSRRIERYRMTLDEVMDCVRTAVGHEHGTVVLQAGEDPGLTCEFVTRLVRRIKMETPLAVTLSLGERALDELAEWREAGADRYLLKHETSDQTLFRAIHPRTGDIELSRLDLLLRMRELGYEIGSGVMVGIPGQTLESLADDIVLFQELDLDMVGIGPFVPHPETPLGRRASDERRVMDRQNQVPATDLMTTKVVALTRLVCPDANIPSTTALATANREHGRELGLARGANVWMPNLTAMKYQQLYDIYPGKAAVVEPAERYHENLLSALAALGRRPGRGPGGRRRSTA